MTNEINQTLTQIQEETAEKIMNFFFDAGVAVNKVQSVYVRNKVAQSNIRVVEKVNKEWLSLNLRNDNKENWDKELSKFGLFMQELSTLIK